MKKPSIEHQKQKQTSMWHLVEGLGKIYNNDIKLFPVVYTLGKV